MTSSPEDDPLSPTVRTAQIITLSLAMGVASFLVITVVSLRAGRTFAADPLAFRGPLTPLALSFAAIALAGHGLIRDAFAGRKVAALARGMRVPRADEAGLPVEAPEGDTPALLTIYAAGRIVGMAILEWAAFFATIAYFLEGSVATFGAAVILVVVILLGIPTRPRVEAWVERQQARIAEIRQFGG